MDLDQRFANYVAKRYGVITRTQARSLGNTDSAIDRRIKQALWIPIFREVYRVAAVPRSFEQGVLAATIAARGAAAMRTALRMHGIHGYQGNIVEILSSTTRRPRSGIFRFHHTDRLPHSDIVHIGCIRQPGPWWTWGRRSRPSRSRSLLTQRCGRGRPHSMRCEESSMREEARVTAGQACFGGFSTNGPRAACPKVLWRPYSGAFECAHRIPQPVAQYVVQDLGRFVARLDFAYPELKVAIEFQSYEWHSGRQEWQKDIERYNRLQDLGWIIVYVTWHELRTQPQEVAALGGSHSL